MDRATRLDPFSCGRLAIDGIRTILPGAYPVGAGCPDGSQTAEAQLPRARVEQFERRGDGRINRIFRILCYNIRVDESHLICLVLFLSGRVVYDF